MEARPAPSHAPVSAEVSSHSPPLLPLLHSLLPHCLLPQQFDALHLMWTFFLSIQCHGKFTDCTFQCTMYNVRLYIMNFSCTHAGKKSPIAQDTFQPVPTKTLHGTTHSFCEVQQCGCGGHWQCGCGSHWQCEGVWRRPRCC